MIDGSWRLVAHACSAISASSVPRLELDVWLARSPLLRGEELLRRKDGPSRQHVKHRAPDFVGQNRQRFALAGFFSIAASSFFRPSCRGGRGPRLRRRPT